jgi:hypothetical protein
MDRSKCVTSSLQLVQQERRFYFIGRSKREVIFSVLADSLEEARQKFRASGSPTPTPSSSSKPKPPSTWPDADLSTRVGGQGDPSLENNLRCTIHHDDS